MLGLRFMYIVCPKDFSDLGKGLVKEKKPKMEGNTEKLLVLIHY